MSRATVTARASISRTKCSIVIDGNRSAAVGPAEQVDIPKGAKVIDASGKT